MQYTSKDTFINYCLHCGERVANQLNPQRLTWPEWLAASGGCSILAGPDNKRKGALLRELHKAWLAGEDPTEYRA